jgi:hypothetical protein
LLNDNDQLELLKLFKGITLKALADNPELLNRPKSLMQAIRKLTI